MHIADPNGSIREYRKRRDVRDNYLGILFGIGFLCVVGGLTALWFVVESVVHNGGFQWQ